MSISKLLTWMVFLLLMSSASLRGEPVWLAPSVAPGWAGVWETSAGAMKLENKGNSVEGTYLNPDGSIRGSLSGTWTGDVLTGSWLQDAGRRRGQFKFQLSVGNNAFRGTWTEGSKTGPWSGSRLPPGTAYPPPREKPKPTGARESVGEQDAMSRCTFMRVLQDNDVPGAQWVCRWYPIDSYRKFDVYCHGIDPSGQRNHLDYHVTAVLISEAGDGTLVYRTSPDVTYTFYPRATKSKVSPVFGKVLVSGVPDCPGIGPDAFISIEFTTLPTPIPPEQRNNW